ncbi:MAG: nucleotidyltransferase domain-containing protein [bacterium]|nr:nucleotidyltransferase domain-containing protein [bacterium]
MHDPDLHLGRRFVETRQPEGRVLLCAVTGSHHYGFASADSDLDLKGIHLVPTKSWLGLETPAETHDRMEWYDDVECDLTLHEARKALGLLVNGNGNMLERILSPYQLFPTPELNDLKRLAKQALSRRFARHYLGYFSGQIAEHQKLPEPRLKTMLYTFRVALTGAHLLRTAHLLVDLNMSAREYGQTVILEAIALKQEHGEKATLPPTLDQELRRRWPDLEALIQESLASSPLPEEAPNREDLSEWLRQARIKDLQDPARN